MKAAGIAFTTGVVFLLGVASYTFSQFVTHSKLTPGEFSFAASEPIKVATLNCLDCSQETVFSKYHASTTHLDAVYKATKKGTLTLSFGVGSVVADGKALRPDCHSSALAEGSKLTVKPVKFYSTFLQKLGCTSPIKRYSI